jgi:histidinol-phosphate phosphatase family protein
MHDRNLKLIIFDADDTLRQTTVPGQPAPNAPDQWQLLPNVKETLRRIDWSQGTTHLGIASNQVGVALGFLTDGMARQLIRDMVEDALGYLPPHLHIEICPCPPNSGCECRKPQPAMLLRIMSRCGVAGEETLFVGDLETDREAARRAGVHFMWSYQFFQGGETTPLTKKEADQN